MANSTNPSSPNVNALIPTVDPATLDPTEAGTVRVVLRSAQKIQPDWLGRPPDHVVAPRRKLWGGFTLPEANQGVAPGGAVMDPATGKIQAVSSEHLVADEPNAGTGIPVGQPLAPTFTAQPAAYRAPHGAGDVSQLSIPELETLLAQAKAAEAAKSDPSVDVTSGMEKAAADLRAAQISEAEQKLKDAQTAAKKAKTEQEKADTARDVELAQQALDHLTKPATPPSGGGTVTDLGGAEA